MVATVDSSLVTISTSSGISVISITEIVLFNSRSEISTLILSGTLVGKQLISIAVKI